MRTPLFLSAAAVSLLASTSLAYQFDTLKGPAYPVIIPPPKILFSFGQETWSIAPCQLSVQAEMPPSYDSDTQKWVRDTIGWFVNKEIFI